MFGLFKKTDKEKYQDIIKLDISNGKYSLHIQELENKTAKYKMLYGDLILTVSFNNEIMDNIIYQLNYIQHKDIDYTKRIPKSYPNPLGSLNNQYGKILYDLKSNSYYEITSVGLDVISLFYQDILLEIIFREYDNTFLLQKLKLNKYSEKEENYYTNLLLKLEGYNTNFKLDKETQNNIDIVNDILFHSKEIKKLQKKLQD